MKLLTSDNKRLRIFSDGVRINKRLPKYSNIAEVKKENSSTATLTTNDVNNTIEWGQSGRRDVVIPESLNFDDIADADTRTVNILMKKNQLGDLNLSFPDSSFDTPVITRLSNNQWDKGVMSAYGDGDKKREGFITKVARIFKRKEDAPEEGKEEEEYLVDVLEFFKYVKGIAGESVETYKNRISGYLMALKNANAAGQEALKEKLLKAMIINKYESVLYSVGLYYVVTEDQVVEFAKKCEKGLSLDYITNFIRPIPQEVIDKINVVNGYEIFDNYVILHYDPEEKSYAETIAEKKEKERKRKDPIVFGVISGSDKLYYIADWIDEYCDLTLEKFVDTLGVDKEYVKMPAEVKI